MKLIPETGPRTPNYWCTWQAQHPPGYPHAEDASEQPDALAAFEGGNAARSSLDRPGGNARHDMALQREKH